MKVLIVILFFSSCSLCIYSLDINLFLDTGIKNGITKELVYEEENCISQLLWKDSIIPTVSIAGEAIISNVSLKLGMSFIIPIRSGILEDYDYLLADISKPSHYSMHNIYLDKEFIFDSQIAYIFKIKTVYIKPVLAFKYSNMKWTASDGYLQYPLSGYWTGNETKIEIKGPVISYEQAIWFPYGGIEIGKIFYSDKMNSQFELALSGSIYPYIWAVTNDIHFLRDLNFYDVLSGGIGWKMNLIIKYFPANIKNIGFIINASYEELSNINGSISSSSTGVSSDILVKNQGYNSKICSNKWSFSISLFIRIFESK